MTSFSESSVPPVVDMHVHVVGTGAGGTGCWLRTRGIHSWLARFMVWHIGLPQSALAGDLDRLYAEKLAGLVRESPSVDAAAILAMDEVWDERGDVIEGRGSFYVPNDYIFLLARQYPEFLPVCSIHPARPDALEELERCLAAGAVMLKLLPNCHNVNCADRRYRRFWERMAAAGLPLLAHTGGEHTLPVINAAYADPRILEQPLECGVTVLAAHAATRGGLWDPDYWEVLVALMRRFPRLYADISAFAIPARARRFPEVLGAGVTDRIVHGSDYPVPIMAAWACAWGTAPRSRWNELRRIANPLERDVAIKRAAGVPDEVFRRGAGLLRTRSKRNGTGRMEKARGEGGFGR